ncbi:MAG: FMN-binding protein [Eubacterium sp.]|nr:FMN-binding protein [Eubacterium sp.]
MISKIKPVLVLSVICTLVCALLIVTYNLTYVDTSGIITDDLMAACVSATGEANYQLITDREAAGLDSDEFEAVNKIIKNTDNDTFLFEVITDGYAADGIDAVVAMNADGSVNAVAIVALGETPGLGTKINDDEFLAEFSGFSSDITISKNPPAANNEVQAMTGATYSSRGLAKAINTAIAAYQTLNKEVQPA